MPIDQSILDDFVISTKVPILVLLQFSETDRIVVGLYTNKLWEGKNCKNDSFEVDRRELVVCWFCSESGELYHDVEYSYILPSSNLHRGINRNVHILGHSDVTYV